MSRILDRDKGQQFSIVAKKKITMAVLTLVVMGAAFLYAGCNLITWLPHTLAQEKTIALNGADQWDSDEQVTRPETAFQAPDARTIAVSPLFDSYYRSHGATSSLGTPVTTAFPAAQGWLQFFSAGALLLPAAQYTPSKNATDELNTLIKSGTKDPASGIVRLYPLQALLTAGSQVPIDGSTFTYADLRKATNPDFMLPDPVTNQSSPSSPAKQGFFIRGGTRAGKDVGHFVPQALWNYMNRADVSPAGWERDFGTPLTEALPVTVTTRNGTHHLLLQAFSRDGLLLDQGTTAATDQPIVQRLTTGVDYLRTLGFPAVTIRPGQSVWTRSDATVLQVPGVGQVSAHLGQNFPLTLLGDTNWTTGTLWYHVQWSTPKSTMNGWVSSVPVTFTSPGHVPAWASFDALSSDLASYLAHAGPNVGAVVYDITRQRYYTYNSKTQFMMASSVKVPIMLTFFDMVEGQGREPDDQEMSLLTTMIENSDNDAASELYYNHIGAAQGITNYMQKIGVADVNPASDAWGYSSITPQAMVDLLTLLHEGKILTEQDRATALNLMENIESDQQVGVGDSAPAGATVAMKDGWVTGPDDLWLVNSSGIITAGQETYSIAVYTQEQQSLDEGQAIVHQVCSSVASLLS